MSNLAPSLAVTKTQSIAGAPVARQVLFEIGVILALHLAFALAVTSALQFLSDF
ncbi:MAG: hypothetical protein WCP68_04700 [Enhydrobacter sp.]